MNQANDAVARFEAGHRRRIMRHDDRDLPVAEIIGHGNGLTLAFWIPDADLIDVCEVPRRNLRAAHKLDPDQDILVRAPGFDIAQRDPEIATARLFLGRRLETHAVLVSELRAALEAARHPDYPGDIDDETGDPFVEFDVRAGVLHASMRTLDATRQRIVGRQTTTISHRDAEALYERVRTDLESLFSRDLPPDDLDLEFAGLHIQRVYHAHYIHQPAQGLSNRLDMAEFFDAIHEAAIGGG
jgi:hypothetical protein